MSAGVRHKKWSLSLQVMDGMTTLEEVPNRICFNNLLAACKISSNWFLGLAKLQQMDEEALQPNVVSFNNLLGACEETAEWQRALESLQQMSVRRLEPNEISFSLFLGALGRGKEWQMALTLLQEMSRWRGDHLMSRTSAMSACRRAKKWQAALAARASAMEDMDTAALSTAILALEDGNRWMATLGLYESAGGRVALDVLARAQQWEVTMALRSAHLSKALLAACPWRVATVLWPRSGDEPALESTSAVCSACAEGTQWRMALEIFSHLPRLDEVIFSCLLGAFGKARQWQEAIQLMMSMPPEQLGQFHHCEKTLPSGNLLHTY